MWRMGDFNRRRLADNNDAIGFGIGLHVGNVMFGNVGLQDRLTFSAFGSAVNEVTRLQNLTKKYPNQLIASKEFASYCGGNGWVTLGREKLAGVGRKLTVLSPEMTEAVMEEDDGGIEDQLRPDVRRRTVDAAPPRRRRKTATLRAGSKEASMKPSEMQHPTITSFCEPPRATCRCGRHRRVDKQGVVGADAVAAVSLRAAALMVREPRGCLGRPASVRRRGVGSGGARG